MSPGRPNHAGDHERPTYGSLIQHTQNTTLTRIIITTTNYIGKVLGYRSSLAIVFVVFLSYHVEITIRPLKPAPLQQTPVCAFPISTLCFHRKPHLFLPYVPQLISVYFTASPDNVMRNLVSDLLRQTEELWKYSYHRGPKSVHLYYLIDSLTLLNYTREMSLVVSWSNRTSRSVDDLRRKPSVRRTTFRDRLRSDVLLPKHLKWERGEFKKVKLKHKQSWTMRIIII